MAIDFPNSPTVGDTYITNGKQYRWDGTAWGIYGTFSPDSTASDTEPTGVGDGHIWYRSDQSQTLIRYDNTWVEVGSAGGFNSSSTSFPASLDSGTGFAAVEALQAKVGVDSSAVTTSLDYKVAQLEARNTAALVVVKAETAFSAVSSVTADNVFTSDYTNYLVSITYSTSSTQPFYYRLRASGTSTSSNYNGQRVVISGSSTSPVRVTGGTAEFAGFTTGGTSDKAGSQLVLYGPQLAEKTVFFNNNSQNDAGIPMIGMISGYQSDSTAFDGIELLVFTGTVTGTYTIYGFAQ